MTDATFTRESTGVFEIYACGSCGARRPWGNGHVRITALPPEPTPALRCERCRTTTRHGFVESRALNVETTLKWSPSDSCGAPAAWVVGVEWTGVDGNGLNEIKGAEK